MATYIITNNLNHIQVIDASDVLLYALQKTLTTVDVDPEDANWVRIFYSGDEFGILPSPAIYLVYSDFLINGIEPQSAIEAVELIQNMIDNYDPSVDRRRTLCIRASQSGTDAPSLTGQLFNQSGITPTFAYTSIGEYLLNCAGYFTLNRTKSDLSVIEIIEGDYISYCLLIPNTVDSCVIKTYKVYNDGSVEMSDDLLVNQIIKAEIF